MLNCSEFQLLDVRSQQELLNERSPLFVQMLLGLNFLVESRHISNDKKSEEQPKKRVWISNFAQTAFLDRLNAFTGLFTMGSDLDAYGRLILKLKGLPQILNCEQKSIFAYILLFNGLKKDNSVENLYNSLRTCEDCLTLTNLISTLNSMANFCSDNINLNE